MKYRILLAGLFASMVAGTSQATLIHQYDFNGNLNDSLGGIALASRGGTTNQSSYVFARGQGLALNEILGKSYTIDISYQFSTLSGYQKILDFSALRKGAGLYTNGNVYSFVGAFSGEGSALAINQPTRVTLTRTESGFVSVYQNGTPIYIWNDWPNFADLSSFSLEFFQADAQEPWSKNGAGSIDYIRIYDDALTAEEVLGKPEAPNPPSVPVPEPGSVALIACGLGLLGLMRRRGQG